MYKCNVRKNSGDTMCPPPPPPALPYINFLSAEFAKSVVKAKWIDILVRFLPFCFFYKGDTFVASCFPAHCAPFEEVYFKEFAPQRNKNSTNSFLVKLTLWRRKAKTMSMLTELPPMKVYQFPLALKVPITTAADDTFNTFFFSYFS